VVTQDLDFTRMLATRGATLPSIIQLRVDCPIPEVIGPALISVLHAHRQSLETGCLISLDHANHRLRLLPIR
jgi:predicted nuclease of predicted toxin-antitoxin system